MRSAAECSSQSPTGRNTVPTVPPEFTGGRKHQRFDEKLQKMFSSISIKEGTIWIEAFYDGKDYYFNEAGYRYGGSAAI